MYHASRRVLPERRAPKTERMKCYMHNFLCVNPFYFIRSLRTSLKKLLNGIFMVRR